MKKILYAFLLLPALSFAVDDIDVAMYDEAYGVEAIQTATYDEHADIDIHVAMYDEAYPTNNSINAARILAKINSLPPTAAGPLKEYRDCNDY